MRIGLMATCLGDVIRPAAPRAVVRILRRLGHQVVFPEAQTCCGQPLFNSGFADLARQQARHTIAVFDECDTVVTPSGSCAAMVKIEYPRLLADDQVWRARAESLAARLFEFADLVANQLKTLDVGAQFHGKIAYHYACHLRMLPGGDAAERLLRHVRGATLVPLVRQDQCCGFGGSFAVRYPEISGTLVDDKMNCLLETGAEVVVSTDTGCLMNIGGRLHRAGHAIRVEHIAEFLDASSASSPAGDPLDAAL